MPKLRDLKSSGKEFFGDKSRAFLLKTSRHLVEDINNHTVLYFEVDYERSKKNFYGELIVKAFVEPKGVPVKGVITLKEGSDVVQGEIPNKILTLEFACYIEHLQELGIDPKRGDYFATKNRHYFIFDKTIPDSNEKSIGTDQQSYAIIFKCVQADSEQLLPPGDWNGVEGTKNEIENTSQTNNLPKYEK